MVFVVFASYTTLDSARTPWEYKGRFSSATFFPFVKSEIPGGKFRLRFLYDHAPDLHEIVGGINCQESDSERDQITFHLGIHSVTPFR